MRKRSTHLKAGTIKKGPVSAQLRLKSVRGNILVQGEAGSDVESLQCRLAKL